jgi:mRNA interferase MazF
MAQRVDCKSTTPGLRRCCATPARALIAPKIFNERTSLVIGLPMTTAAYNADNPFTVAVGAAGGRRAGQTSYVLCHQPKSFDWHLRSVAPHPMKRIPDARFAEVLVVLNQIVQLA